MNCINYKDRLINVEAIAHTAFWPETAPQKAVTHDLYEYGDDEGSPATFTIAFIGGGELDFRGSSAIAVRDAIYAASGTPVA